MNTDKILELVQRALDQFDDRPLTVSVRRTIRLAVLLDDTELAVRLAQDIRPIGGSQQANVADIKRLMSDPSEYGKLGSPSRSAVDNYISDRERKDGLISVHTLEEIEHLQSVFGEMAQNQRLHNTEEILGTQSSFREILERTRARVFSALCAWERELTFKGRYEQIFTSYQQKVDRIVAEQAPEVLDSFNAVYRRLGDAARLDERDAKEELSQAVTTCRRILKEIVDGVLPPEDGKSIVGEDGQEIPLDDQHYKVRLTEYIKRQSQSRTLADAIDADVTGILKRFKALDGLANQGVHAVIAYSEAEQCAINTYIIAGEILSLQLKNS
jgi:hypothetical protein